MEIIQTRRNGQCERPRTLDESLLRAHDIRSMKRRVKGSYVTAVEIESLYRLSLAV
jgi:hypothetical protein